jgi:hypothetical protein
MANSSVSREASALKHKNYDVPRELEGEFNEDELVKVCVHARAVFTLSHFLAPAQRAGSATIPLPPSPSPPPPSLIHTRTYLQTHITLC